MKALRVEFCSGLAILVREEQVLLGPLFIVQQINPHREMPHNTLRDVGQRQGCHAVIQERVVDSQRKRHQQIKTFKTDPSSELEKMSPLNAQCRQDLLMAVDHANILSALRQDAVKSLQKRNDALHAFSRKELSVEHGQAQAFGSSAHEKSDVQSAYGP